MIPQSIRNYLDDKRIRYRLLAHEPRSTTQQTAQAAHISGKRFAKSVLLRMEGNGGDAGLLLAVLPADEHVDLKRLSQAAGRPLRLASEEDMTRLFPESERGAAPPFGQLAGIPVIADVCLSEQGTIVFHGGSHTDLIEMSWDDFKRLAAPRIIDYGVG